MWPRWNSRSSENFLKHPNLVTRIEYHVPGYVLGCVIFLLLLLTNYHKLSGSNNTILLLHGSIGQKSEVSLG